MSTGAILVTGAGGFVCSEIVCALRRAGHQVVATDRSFDAATRARLHDEHLIEAPLEEALASIGRLQAVIHGAALTADPQALGLTAAEHLRRNIGMAASTLATAREQGAARALFLSSMGVFAPHDGPVTAGRVTEATVPTGAIPYAAAKRAGEILTAAAADTQMDTLSLRLGNIAGPHEAIRDSRQHLSLIGRMIAQARATGQITLNGPEGLREWAWLPDLADAVVELLHAPWAGARVLHAGTPPVIGQRALADAIAVRMPGVRVVEPSDQTCGAARALRPPMGSDHDGPMRSVNWTAPDTILDRLIAAKVLT
ncbi:NAD-dependent epimerase/dehydratase family protein [Roseicitreum antarcticum]|uniref:Nucleoside-diphosphate-sugar epimerase n=1 Tax=Roseicitreum antarcticum TaxID=564137 RepID=A0A1H3D2G2_9RHOB|nr:NAD-dependent epimerase/dehydratase family protein [Roseicitreum antarcticum]SDX59964.1 Nucleoside-diphosphate-sugar epimerase [Roseicitreum antarcticum]